MADPAADYQADAVFPGHAFPPFAPPCRTDICVVVYPRYVITYHYGTCLTKRFPCESIENGRDIANTLIYLYLCHDNKYIESLRSAAWPVLESE